jgi:hypothetical protein
MIVNDLAVAIYEREIPTLTNERVMLSKEESIPLTTEIKHVMLEAEKAQEAFRGHYDDERMLGKHFRVEWGGSLQADRVNRHYTISNVMNPTVYNAVLESLQNDKEIAPKTFSTEPSQFVRFTLKNYKQPAGLSFRLFEEE